MGLLTAPADFRHPLAVPNNATITIPASRSAFTIVQFADLHFGEDNEKDERSAWVMRDVLTAEPGTDLVVFSGDQVSGWLISNPRDTLRKWAESLRSVSAMGVPFVTIFGNHDDQAFGNGHIVQYMIAQGVFVVSLLLCLCLASRRVYSGSAGLFLLCVFILVIVCWPSNVMRRSLLYYEQASFSRLSLSQEGPPGVHGLSNYVLRVFRGPDLLLQIFLLDSGGGRLFETYTDSQLAWLMSTPFAKDALAIAFVHIPPVQFREALSDPERFACIGHNHTEQVVPASQERLNLMQTLTAVGVKAVFAGHDHMNSYCCVPTSHDPVISPAMCYGRHTGHGGYGQSLMRGARVVRLEFDAAGPTITTWLRMEDRSVQEWTVLHSPTSSSPRAELSGTPAAPASTATW
jgi:hypothetical protein